MTLSSRAAASSYSAPFAADRPVERRDDALLALVSAGVTPREISELIVDDVRLFDDSATVRIVFDGDERFVRLRDPRAVERLRAYMERDLPMRRTSPLFPGRSPIVGLTYRRIYQLLDRIRETRGVKAGA